MNYDEIHSRIYIIPSKFHLGATYTVCNIQLKLPPMSSSAPRWIVVDDSATDIINYTGPWFTDYSDSQDAIGDDGPVFQETLHGVNNNASLSFAFDGSQVKLHGSNNLSNNSGVLDPVWECFIDNVSIGATPPSLTPQNNWLFCDSQTKISDGPHILTVNVQVTKSQTFWVDQIQYIPSSSLVPLDNGDIYVDSSDPQLAGAYGAGWGALTDIANMTNQTGSLFTFDFVGASLSWYGFIPNGYPIAESTSTYSIDGQTPDSFFLKGLPNTSSPSMYNQKFFRTKTHPPGRHQIVVTFQGNITTTPLTLDYLLIQNASIPATASAQTSGASSGSSNGGTLKGKSNNGALAGGIVGGSVVILLAILAYLLIRRRKRELHRPFVRAGVLSSEIVSDTGRQGSGRAMTEVRGSSQPNLSLAGFSLTQSGMTPIPSASNGPLLNASITGHGHFAHSQDQGGSTVGVTASTSRARKPTVLHLQAPSLARDDSVASRCMHHADSGVRLPSVAIGTETERVAEVPPEYTLS